MIACCVCGAVSCRTAAVLIPSGLTLLRPCCMPGKLHLGLQKLVCQPEPCSAILRTWESLVNMIDP